MTENLKLALKAARDGKRVAVVEGENVVGVKGDFSVQEDWYGR